MLKALLRRFSKPDHAVCEECGVHFEPVTGAEARWGHLCAAHRPAVKKRDRQRDEVLLWAELNWERLVEQMELETAKRNAAKNQALATMANAIGQAQCRSQGDYGQGLGNNIQGGQF